MNKEMKWNGINTRKTVSKLCQKESKLLRGSSMFSKLNLPPKTCMPSRAKMTMKRKSRRSKEAIDWIELSSDATRLDKERQYLQRVNREKRQQHVTTRVTQSSHKRRRRRRRRRLLYYLYSLWVINNKSCAEDVGTQTRTLKILQVYSM